MCPLTAEAAASGRSRRSGDMLGWWRNGVTYQVYVRSFQDSDGDGIGDLEGVRARLPYLRSLGVGGIWLNPFYASPQHDHGYDVSDYLAVHHEYVDLAAFDRLVRDAHRLDLKVIVDVVPNHCSIEHPWFTAAVAAGPGSPERRRFHFADGRGQHGELPPNNWRSIFGGPAWRRIGEPDGTPGQWYLHTFAPEQADFNWRHPEVAEHFEKVLRFWLDRGVDGLRVDVAHGLHKREGLPDHEFAIDDEVTGDPVNPYAWNQPEVHDVWRSWRALAEEYTDRTGRERALVGEVDVLDTDELASYQRPDKLHQSFYFEFLRAPWDAESLSQVIDRGHGTIAAHDSPVTWVLTNHDMPRSVTRYAGGAPGVSAGDVDLGLTRARAAALLMLALPGAVYVYQGEELGLPEVVDLPDGVLRDPMFQRTGGARRGGTGAGVRCPGRPPTTRSTSPRRARTPRPGCLSPTGSPSTPWTASSSPASPCSSCTARQSPCDTACRPSPGADSAGCRRGRVCSPSRAATALPASSTSPPRPVCAPPGSRLLLGSDPEVGDRLPPDSAGWFLPETAS